MTKRNGGWWSLLLLHAGKIATTRNVLRLHRAQSKKGRPPCSAEWAANEGIRLGTALAAHPLIPHSSSVSKPQLILIRVACKGSVDAHHNQRGFFLTRSTHTSGQRHVSANTTIRYTPRSCIRYRWMRPSNGRPGGEPPYKAVELETTTQHTSLV